MELPPRSGGVRVPHKMYVLLPIGQPKLRHRQEVMRKLLLVIMLVIKINRCVSGQT